MERSASLDVNVAANLIYGKIAFYNIAALFREQLELCLNKKQGNKYLDQINVKVLLTELHANRLVACFTSVDGLSSIRTIMDILTLKINQMKTPIRPDRSYSRWGKCVTQSYRYRFRIDGRTNPRVALVNGVMKTVRP